MTAVRPIALAPSALLIRHFLSILRSWPTPLCRCNNLLLDRRVVGCVRLCIDISLVLTTLLVSVLTPCICNDLSGLCGNTVGVIPTNLTHLVTTGELN